MRNIFDVLKQIKNALGEDNEYSEIKAGIMIDAVAIDKMKDLRLLIDRDNECGRAYIIRVIY